MRALAQPGVLKSAIIAAALSALVSFPRLVLWPTRHYPLWYLSALLFLGGTVLWAFVFAWHTKYCGLPVFTGDFKGKYFQVATVSGALLGIVLRIFLDPVARSVIPDDYPATLGQWLAMTLFSLGFTQLFLVFAPFAWMLRLSQNRNVAVVFTIVFGVAVLLIKTRSSPTPLPLALLAALLLVRVAGGLLSLYLYLRGGVLLVWWCGLLVQTRHLFGLGSGS
jgi:hypothetical protein